MADILNIKDPTTGKWTGIPVLKGDKGEQGPQGPQGIQGEKGEKGDTGEVSLEYANNTFAPVIRCTVKGGSVAINDISDIDHKLNVKISSKNLLPNNYLSKEDIITDSYSVIFNEDGTITLNGDFGNNFYCNVGLPKEELEPGAYYVLSGDIPDVADFQLAYYEDASNPSASTTVSGGGFFIWQKGYGLLGAFIRCWGVIENAVIKPQLEKGNVVTPYTPNIIDYSNIEVKRCGRNLLPYPYATTLPNVSNYGGTFTLNADRSITASGYPTNYVGFDLYNGKPLATSSKLIIYFADRNNNIGTATENVSMTLIGCDADNKSFTFAYVARGTTIVNLDLYPKFVKWIITVNRSANNQNIAGTFYPVIEVGETANGYIDYIEPQISIADADGNVAGLTSLAPTTSLVTDRAGTILTCTHNADTKKYIDNKFAELSAALLNS